jgi:hypothetical protein
MRVEDWFRRHCDLFGLVRINPFDVLVWIGFLVVYIVFLV